MKNIQLNSSEKKTPNINNPYTVTEKADGLRKLMFINSKGSIYLINTNMELEYGFFS